MYKSAVWETLLSAESARSMQSGTGMNARIVSEAVHALRTMRDDGLVELTARSLRLLALGDDDGDSRDASCVDHTPHDGQSLVDGTSAQDVESGGAAAKRRVNAAQVDFAMAMAVTKLSIEVM
jgi:hypothetical protein